jgi:hypothetical protein
MKERNQGHVSSSFNF